MSDCKVFILFRFCGQLCNYICLFLSPTLLFCFLRNYQFYHGSSYCCFCLLLGQGTSLKAKGSEMQSESKLRDLLHGSEDVLTYEDKDGDWMLVGDVPWE